MTHVGPLDGWRGPGTIGLPLPDTDVQIVDPADGRTEAPPGHVGELIIKGPQVMLGYLNDPEATVRTRSATVGSTRATLRRVTRMGSSALSTARDLIITSGFNVYPSDVEHVLRACPESPTPL